MILTDEDKEDFENSTNCHICDGELGEDRVRDHCHLSGKFRGAAHTDCNLNYRTPRIIPIYFHNLSNYDAHLFIKRLGKPEENIAVLLCLDLATDFAVSNSLIALLLPLGSLPDDLGLPRRRLPVRLLVRYR